VIWFRIPYLTTTRPGQPGRWPTAGLFVLSSPTTNNTIAKRPSLVLFMSQLWTCALMACYMRELGDCGTPSAWNRVWNVESPGFHPSLACSSPLARTESPSESAVDEDQDPVVCCQPNNGASRAPASLSASLFQGLLIYLPLGCSRDLKSQNRPRLENRPTSAKIIYHSLSATCSLANGEAHVSLG